MKADNPDWGYVSWQTVRRIMIMHGLLDARSTYAFCGLAAQNLEVVLENHDQGIAAVF